VRGRGPICQQEFEGGPHVGGGDGLAVVPLGVTVEFEGVDQPVIADGPLLGQIGLDRVVGIEGDQGPKDVAGGDEGVWIRLKVEVERRRIARDCGDHAAATAFESYLAQW
jgi:hypothetical protein